MKTLILAAVLGWAAAQSSRYYGLPLGAFHYSADRTSAEVYAADPNTAVLVNFHHQPIDQRCTTLMAGPVRKGIDTLNVASSGDGILIPIKVQQRSARERNKRNAFENAFFGYPFELDNLRVEGRQGGDFAAVGSDDPFGGIELELGDEANRTATTTTARTTTRTAATTTTGKQNKRWPYTNIDRSPPPKSGTPSRSTGKAKATGTKTTTTKKIPDRGQTLVVFDMDGKEKRLTTTTKSFTPRRRASAESTTSNRLAAAKPSPLEEEVLISPIRRPQPFRTKKVATTSTSTTTAAATTTTTTTVSTTRRPRSTKAGRTSRRPPTTSEAPTTSSTKTPLFVIVPSRRRQRPNTPTTTAKTTTKKGPGLAVIPRENVRNADIETAAKRGPGLAVVPRENVRNRDSKTTTEGGPGLSFISHEDVRSRDSKTTVRRGPGLALIPRENIGNGLISLPATSVDREQRYKAGKVKGPGLLVVDPSDTHGFRPPINVNPRFFGPLPRAHEVESVRLAKKQANTVGRPPTATLGHDTVNDDGYIVVFGQTPPPRRSPPSPPPPSALGPPSASQQGGGLVFFFGDRLAGQEENEAEKASSSTTKPDANKLFTVIEDPRAERRTRRQQQQQGKQQRQTTLSSNKGRGASDVLATPNLPRAGQGERFEVGVQTGQVSLVEAHFPRGAAINDFDWFGLYDHCRQRTAFVSTKGIRPPQEVTLKKIEGSHYGVASGRVTVVNCNTLLIPNFTYKGADFGDAHFIVGIGDFPHYIAQRTNAIVVGAASGRPLRNYDGEEVTLLLPKGWKTFDINFLSIYNEKKRISYGHAAIPPVVVPPCEPLN